MPYGFCRKCVSKHLLQFIFILICDSMILRLCRHNRSNISLNLCSFKFKMVVAVVELAKKINVNFIIFMISRNMVDYVIFSCHS